jgi:hypothetical protein
MAVTEPPYLNIGSGIAARNGTASHTINFGYTSTSGSLLVVVIYGAVTHTASGWTERLQPVSSGELSVFTKTSAGDSSISVTHNASNYASYWVAYEFPAGSTYTAGEGNSDTSDTFPALTGLPGTVQVIIAARGRVVATSAATSGSSVWSSPWVEDADIFDAFASGTDNGYLTVAHRINYTSTSITPATTTTYGGTWTVNDRQHAGFAIDAVEISSAVNGAATLASASTLTATATVIRLGAATLASTSAMASTATRLGVATAASTSTLTAAAASVRTAAAAIASTSTLTAAATVIRLGVAAAASTSSLAAGAAVVRLGVAASISTSTLTAAVVVICPGAAVLTSTSTLTGNTSATANGTAAIASTSTLTAAAETARLGAAGLSSTSALASASVVIVQTSATLVGASALSSAAVVVVASTAVLASVSSISATPGNANRPGRLAVATAASRLVAADEAPRLVASTWP